MTRSRSGWVKQQPRIRVRILTSVELLRALGPQLGRPHVDRIEGSVYPNMKELRVQIDGDPWRVLFAFVPNGRPSCSPAGTRRLTSGSMTSTSRSPTRATLGTWSD